MAVRFAAIESPDTAGNHEGGREKRIFVDRFFRLAGVPAMRSTENCPE